MKVVSKPRSGDIKRRDAQRSVLDHGMTHVMVPDERRRRLASGADLHASEEYDVAQPCSDLNKLHASLLSSGSLCQFRRQLKTFLFVKDSATAPSDSCF